MPIESKPMTPLRAVDMRELPHPVAQYTWRWSVFSEEKGLYFNGYALHTDEGLILIDPPSADERVINALLTLGVPRQVLLTNRDHERESVVFHQRFGIPVAIHALDAPLLTAAPDIAFNDGDLLPGGLRVIHLPDQKSPGECAFYQALTATLFVGDALIGRNGKLGMLPDDKFADSIQAFQSLKRLQNLDLPIETLMLGDGESITQDVEGVLTAFFSSK